MKQYRAITKDDIGKMPHKDDEFKFAGGTWVKLTREMLEFAYKSNDFDDCQYKRPLPDLASLPVGAIDHYEILYLEFGSKQARILFKYSSGDFMCVTERNEIVCVHASQAKYANAMPEPVKKMAPMSDNEKMAFVLWTDKKIVVRRCQGDSWQLPMYLGVTIMEEYAEITADGVIGEAKKFEKGVYE